MNATAPRPDLKALAQTALAHQNANRFAEAAQAYAALLSHAPDSWAACYNLGLVFQHLQRLPEAADMYARAVRINPQLAEGYNNLGNVLKTLKNTAAAVEAYQHALRLNPRLSEASYNLATMLQAKGDSDASIDAFRQAIAGNPAHGHAWDALYRGLLGLARQEEAIQAFLDWEKAAELSPEMVVAGLALCRPMAAREREDRYLSLAISWPFASFTPEQYAPVLGMIQYFDISREDLLACYRRYDQATAAQRPAITPQLSRRAADTRLRIGYVSGDFRRHVMGRIMLDVISRHDRTQFSVLLISTCPRSQHDAVTTAFRERVDGFADISELDDAAAAKSIAEADIDVLVDLAGHTNTARPAIYAHRPARSIITHLGYHGCLGLKAVDFKLTDRIADAADAAEYQIERPYALNRCLFPFVRVAPPPTNSDLGEGLNLSGKFVFGAFINVLKLSSRCLAVWRRVLDAVPEATLLFSPLSKGEEAAIERITAAAGIESSRIAILKVSQRDESYLRARYRLVNAVLDTFPYAGGDTTLAALDMGIPVVAHAPNGRRQSERIGASILTHLGLAELVAETEDAFVQVATRLARDHGFLTSTCKKIEIAAAAAAADSDSYTRDLEAAFVDIAAQKPAAGSMKLTARQFFQTLQNAMQRQQSASDDEERRAIAAVLAELRVEQPDYPPLLRAQCELAQALTDLPLAIDCLSELVRQHPDDIDARLALAGFLIDQQAATEAITVLDDALAAGGNSARVLNLRTRAHGQLRQWESARQHSAAAIALAPADAHLAFWHGTVLSHLGEFDAALNFLNRALVLAPDHAEAAYNAGVLLAELGNYADAEKVFRRALGTSAAALAHRRLLHTLKARQRRTEWLLEAERFVRTYPGTEYSRLLESRLARHRGDLNAEARILLPLAEQATMIESDVMAVELIGELLSLLPWHDVSPHLLKQLAVRYAKALAGLHPPMDSPTADPPLTDRLVARRPKVGYLVDFSLPFVSDLMLALAAWRDRNQFDATVYAMSAPALTPQAEQFAAGGINVVSLAAFDEHRAAREIQNDHVDVLIDATGFGAYAKPGVLSHRPAAIQIALPGFSRPISVSEYDFRLSDNELDLALDAVPVPLPVEGSVFPLLPAGASVLLTRASLDIDNVCPVFGVLASVEQLSMRAVGLWKSISDRVPEALFLVCPLDDDDVAPIRKILSAAGIEAARIRSFPASFARPRDLALADVVDVILDTAPGSDYFSVRTSLCEGIPVVTTPGRLPDERVALTMLSHLEERSTVADSGRDYVDVAAQLAGNPERRRDWKARVSALRQQAASDATAPTSSMQVYVRRHEAAVLRAAEAQQRASTNTIA